jgi:ATP-dependent helicase YprA (DUF1998 family)
MKLKTLAKLVADKLGEETDHKMVKTWIEKSEKFSVDGKEVSLAKKRSSAEDDSAAPSKKARTVSPAPSSSSSSQSFTPIEEWRKTNKIVVMHAKDDHDGKEETKKICKDDSYFPFFSFDDPICKAVIAAPLLRQCTEINGFTKPSPIQAQSWPILMNKKNGRKRDVVGIAETGSGKTLTFAMPPLSSVHDGRQGLIEKATFVANAGLGTNA